MMFVYYFVSGGRKIITWYYLEYGDEQEKLD